MEGRNSKRRYLTRVSFRYISGERSVVLLDIDFDADNQDKIPKNVNLGWNFKSTVEFQQILRTKLFID